MKFALLIYESPDAFASGKSDGSDAYTGAWRAYHKALVESGVFVAGDPLEVPETGTMIKIKDGKRGVQDGPYADTKEQLGGFTIIEVPSLDAALEWAARCPAASYGAVEVRPLPLVKPPITKDVAPPSTILEAVRTSLRRRSFDSPEKLSHPLPAG